MIKREKIEDAAEKIFERNPNVDASVYYYLLVDELQGRGVSGRAEPPQDENRGHYLGPESDFYPELKEICGDALLSPEESKQIERGYTVLVEGELHVEVMVRDEITDYDRSCLKDIVESSEEFLFTPDDLSRGVMINFPREGTEPEFYWYEEE